MPRFVLLTHDHPFLHWDLLLENAGTCRTWRLLSSPEVSRSTIEAESIADHRLFYLDYEGPVSGDRGTVTRWDAGALVWLSQTPTECTVRLTGARWRGVFRLEQVTASRWRLTWEPFAT